MHKRSLLGMLLAGALMATPFAIAQNNGSGDQSSPEASSPEGGHRHFDPAQRTERLTKELKLTSDQQPKVLDILKSEQSQMEKVRSDSSLSQEDRRSRMMDIHKASSDEIRALLNADQQKKWDEMQSRREQWQHHHEGQGPGAGI